MRKQELFRRKIDTITKQRGYPPTDYQRDIYEWLWDGEGNALVEAVAGSGKTSTIVSGLNFLRPIDKPKPTALLVAFNKHIAEQLNSRNLPDGCQAGTLHSVAYRAWLQVCGRRPKVESWKTYNIMRDRKIPRECQAPINKLVGLLKSIPARSAEDYIVDELLDRYDVGDWTSKCEDYLGGVYAESIETKSVIDFDDMLVFPLFDDKVVFPYVDYLMVDESQDLNQVQISLIEKMLNGKSRVMFVGDTHQAIYGFRGADPSAIRKIRERFNCESLPLSICWRCGSEIVNRAKEIVPQIEPAPGAEPGEIKRIHVSEYAAMVRPGDYTLCRTTAPLINHAMALIRARRKAVVLGRDIGKGLASLVDLVERDYVPLSGGVDLPDAIRRYRSVESSKLNPDVPRDASALQRLDDRTDCLLYLIGDPENPDYAPTSKAVKERIASIFSDEAQGVTLSTIHKAKGLEADIVYILHPEQMPHPMAKRDWEREQEYNLCYVAITRARQTLIWVDCPKD